MGGILSSAMDDNMRKQQQFMLEMNRITVERQIQMQNQMRERMAATQVLFQDRQTRTLVEST